MLSTLGVIDLSVTEVLWRLIEPNDYCVDVGANIGYMTSLMAARAKADAVYAFEANPLVFDELEFNVARWRIDLPKANLITLWKAVSNRRGEVTLCMPPSFSVNRGLSYVMSDAHPEDTDALDHTVSVESVTLDDTFPNPFRIGVMNVDVEGHEYGVFDGAAGLVAGRRIRDIVFEEHRPYPTAASRKLTDGGYTIFRIARTFLGPSLLPANSTSLRSDWEPTSFLASCEPNRAIHRLRNRGWLSLRHSEEAFD